MRLLFFFSVFPLAFVFAPVVVSSWKEENATQNVACVDVTLIGVGAQGSCTQAMQHRRALQGLSSQREQVARPADVVLPMAVRPQGWAGRDAGEFDKLSTSVASACMASLLSSSHRASGAWPWLEKHATKQLAGCPKVKKIPKTQFYIVTIC